MKTIMEPRSTITKMWSVPKKTERQTYRLMDYILRNTCEDGTLLYNVVTSEMVLLDDGPDLDGILPGTYKPAMDELIDHHFVVPQDYNEKKSVDQLRVILRKLNKPKHITGYTIYPTTCCNARCFYCFESDFVKETMTEETADQVVKYILDHSGGKPISITWFGGEPLVGKHIINYICERLRESGIEFKSSMVSNAYLFDEDTVRTAAERWNLNRVQVTLDGTEEQYNKAKNYQGVRGSPYLKVLDNILLLLDGHVQVTVRLNVTQANVDNLFLLADELTRKFGGRKEFQVYAHMVYDNVGYEPFSYADGAKTNLYEKLLLLQEKLIAGKLSYGYFRLPYLKEVQCMADSDESVTVFPNGKIGKCENRSADEAFADIYGFESEELRNRSKQYLNNDTCGNCRLYPKCLFLSVCPEKEACSTRKASVELAKYSELLIKYYKHYKEHKACDTDNQPLCDDEEQECRGGS